MKKKKISLFVVAIILGCTGNIQAAAALAATSTPTIATQTDAPKSKLAQTELVDKAQKEAATEKLVPKINYPTNKAKCIRALAGTASLLAGIACWAKEGSDLRHNFGAGFLYLSIGLYFSATDAPQDLYEIFAHRGQKTN